MIIKENKGWNKDGTTKITEIRLHVRELKANYGRKVWTIDAKYVNQKTILQKCLGIYQKLQESKFE